MENLSAWLQRLELERYEAVFAANDVDFDVLRMLSEYGFPVWLSLSRIIRGEARAALGEGDEGIDDIRQGIRDFEATGTQMSRPYNVSCAVPCAAPRGSRGRGA